MSNSFGCDVVASEEPSTFNLHDAPWLFFREPALYDLMYGTAIADVRNTDGRNKYPID